MDNLIGDEIDRWPELVAEPAAHVHIYGKGEARPGRKMGHVTRLASRRASTTSIGIPSFSSCGRTLAASPTTIQVKPLGSSAERAAWSSAAVVCARYSGAQRLVIIVGPAEHVDVHHRAEHRARGLELARQRG